MCLVMGHHDVGELDDRTVVIERVIRPSCCPGGIGKQGKIEPQLGGVVEVSVHPGGVHAEGLDPGSLELGHLVAHGGELAISPRSVVARVEHERDVLRLQDVGKRVGLAVGRFGLEYRRLAADGQEFGHEMSLRFSETTSRDALARRCSSCSNHSSGTSRPPSVVCASPSSVSPCQSDPPLMASPRRCAMRVSRCSTAGEWLGGRTSSPTNPCPSNGPVCPPLPCS